MKKKIVIESFYKTKNYNLKSHFSLQNEKIYEKRLKFSKKKAYFLFIMKIIIEI